MPVGWDKENRTHFITTLEDSKNTMPEAQHVLDALQDFEWFFVVSSRRMLTNPERIYKVFNLVNALPDNPHFSHVRVQILERVEQLFKSLSRSHA